MVFKTYNVLHTTCKSNDLERFKHNCDINLTHFVDQGPVYSLNILLDNISIDALFITQHGIHV